MRGVLPTIGASPAIASRGVDAAPDEVRCALRRDGDEWIVLVDGRSFRLKAAGNQPRILRQASLAGPRWTLGFRVRCG
jgi:hypothetical protein